MKRVREESGAVNGKRARPIPVITLSPDSSPVEQPTTEEQLPLIKRTREYVQFIPPIPDAIEVAKVDVVNVRLDSQLMFQVQPACVCPRPPLPNNIQIICRCMQAPFPHVRLMSTARQFELLDTKWAVHLHELTPTTVVNPHMQTRLSIYPLENELFNETEIDITAQVTLTTSTTGGDEIKRQVFELGNHRFRQGSQYLFPINKTMLDLLLNQPIGSPGSAYPSTVNLTAQIQLLVTNHKCLNRDPRFTLDFTKEKSLSNFVIKCGRKALFVDCKYLRHYSEYFNVLSNLSDDMERGLVKRDQESGLPCVNMDETDFDAWNALLLYCSPCHIPVPNRLLVDVIRISDAYQFVTVKKETELRIIRLLKSNEGKDYSDLQLFLIAENYNLVHLKEHTLNSLFRSSAPGVHPDAHFVHVVRTDPFYKQLNDHLKSMLMDRLSAGQHNSFQCVPPGFTGPPGSQ